MQKRTTFALLIFFTKINIQRLVLLYKAFIFAIISEYVYSKIQSI